MIISIIIPVYNVEPYVEKCIRSCISQDLATEDYEIIIVNDGSTDNSLSIIEKVAKGHDNIHITSIQHSGLSVARNTGMSMAQGEYYMFVDSDDWIEHNCLKRLATKLSEEKPDCLAICGANVVDDEFKRRRNHQDETPTTGIAYTHEGPQDGAPFGIWRAQFFKDHNFSFMKGILHEDSELTPRAYYQAKKISRVNDIVYYVYPNPNSITRRVTFQRSFDLIDTVCNSLHTFTQTQVAPEDAVIFHKKISTLFNNAHAVSKNAPKDTVTKFNNKVYTNKHLLINLKKSQTFKYILQYYLIKLFPLHSMQVYRVLKSLA